jgi:SRSO17 transposase
VIIAVGHGLDRDRWRQALDAALDRVVARFARAEPRRVARAFVEGLLSTVERKTCWSLAEHARHADPQPMQRLLRAAPWDAGKVRDDVRDWLLERLGHPQGGLIGDETGFLKKGTCSVGVQRQYTGAVFLAYASPHGRGLIDRRLYLPETTWCAPARTTGRRRRAHRHHVRHQTGPGPADDHRRARRRRPSRMVDR